MKNKKGISLIVLVITIIVMVILAAAVVITLSNTGIIRKANEAVKATTKKQVEQIASLAWSEAFMEGARTQEELQAAVNNALNGMDTAGVTVIVTTTGVSVTEGKDYTNVAAGLYQTGSDYTVLLKSWDDLVDEEIVYIDDGVLYTEATYTNYDYSTLVNNSDSKLVGDLVLPNDGSVTALGNFSVLTGEGYIAFAACKGLTNIIIPDSVTAIGDGAFALCTALTTITLPNNLTYIAAGCFMGCEKLATVNFSRNVNNIGMLAFSECNSIQRLDFVSNKITCDSDAFNGCTNLKKLNFDCEELVFTTTEGRYHLLQDLPSITSAGHGSQYDVNLPVNTRLEFEADGSGPFDDCTNLKKVNLNLDIYNSYYGSFSNCTSITSVGPDNTYDCVLNESNTSLHDVFHNCDGITTAVIPENITSMWYGFNYCDNLKTVYILSGSVDIYESFHECPNLTDIYFAGTQERWNEFYFEDLDGVTVHYNYVAN